jgi:integrase
MAMKGRRHKQTITIREEPDKNRFRVDVPTILSGGARIRRYFPDLVSAELWVAERNLERARTGKLIINEIEKPGNAALRVVVAAYLGSKLGEVCAEHMKVSKNHLGKLVSKFGNLPVDDIDPLICRNWIRALPLAQRTKHGVFSTCRTFYRWAVRYDYAEKNPFDKMELVPKGDASKAILTPEEMAALLDSKMPDYVRSWLILGGFCGLRPIEIARSDWSAVNFETKEIHVSPQVIKRDALRGRGMRERYVQIPDTAMRLLPRGLKGSIIPVVTNTMQAHVRTLAVILAKMRGEATGKRRLVSHGRARIVSTAKWPHDCLRHSAASYMLASRGDAGIVAAWLGHTSTKMVYENYARAVPKEQAAQWWGIKG